MCNLLKILSLLSVISAYSMLPLDLEIQKITEDLERLLKEKDKLSCTGRLVNSLSGNEIWSLQEMSCRAIHTLSNIKLCIAHQNIKDLLDKIIISLHGIAKLHTCEINKSYCNAEKAITDLHVFFETYES